MVGAPFAVTDNDEGGAGVGQHWGRNIAGMRAARLAMTVLPAHGNSRRRGDGGGRGQKRRRGADQEIEFFAQRRIVALGGAFDLSERGAQAVHFPIAGEQRTAFERHEKLQEGVRDMAKARSGAIDLRFAILPL